MPSLPVCPVGHAGSRARLLRRQARVRRRPRRRLPPSSPAAAAPAQGSGDSQGQPPPARHRRPRPTTARLGEYQPHPARPPAAGRELVDGHEPAMDELLPRLLVPLRPRPARRRARPCPVLPVRETRWRQRNEPFAAGQVTTREHSRDRLSAHRRPPERPTSARIPDAGESVRGSGNLCSSSPENPELPLLPRSPQLLAQLARGRST